MSKVICVLAATKWLLWTLSAHSKRLFFLFDDHRMMALFYAVEAMMFHGYQLEWNPLKIPTSHWVYLPISSRYCCYSSCSCRLCPSFSSVPTSTVFARSQLSTVDTHIHIRVCFSPVVCTYLPLPLTPQNARCVPHKWLNQGEGKGRTPRRKRVRKQVEQAVQRRRPTIALSQNTPRPSYHSRYDSKRWVVVVMQVLRERRRRWRRRGREVGVGSDRAAPKASQRTLRK